MANFRRSWVCMISAVICMSPHQVEFDNFVICRVFMHYLGSFLMQDMLSSLHEFAFEGTNLTTQLYLKFLLVTQHEVPFINTSEVTKTVEKPNRERLMYICHEL